MLIELDVPLKFYYVFVMFSSVYPRVLIVMLKLRRGVECMSCLGLFRKTWTC